LSAVAGVGVQFIIPSMLVLAARRRLSASFSAISTTQHRSPFGATAWPMFMFGWAAFTIVVVTLNYLIFK